MLEPSGDFNGSLLHQTIVCARNRRGAGEVQRDRKRGHVPHWRACTLISGRPSGHRPCSGGTRTGKERFTGRTSMTKPMIAMARINKRLDDDDQPEPKTAFLLGLALGAVLPLLVLAASSA